jgi:hypothetical protein
VQIEAPNLAGRDVNVVRTGKKRRFGRAQKTETVGQDFETTVAKDLLAGFGAALQNG